MKSIENLYTDILLGERNIEGKTVRVDAEDIILLKVVTAGGVTILCESDLIIPSYMNYVEVQGTNGSLWTSILDYFPTMVYCQQPKGVYDRGHNFFRFPKVDLFEEELKHFAECICGEKEVGLNSVEQSVKVMELVDRAMATRGRRARSS